MGKLVLGEIPKILVQMSPIGDKYKLSDIEWKVEFYSSRGKCVITKEEAEQVDANSYSVRVDTTRCGVGILRGILYPTIPDADLPEGVYTPPVLFDTGEEIVPKYSREYGVLNS